jgi:pimeloyl-ACP methyl ester carboxylesterase
LQQIVQELHDALHKMHIAGPYILVSHATGTNTIRAFADNYLDEVASLVFIDAAIRDMESDPDLRKLWVDLDAKNLAELHMCRDAIVAGKKPPLVPPQDHPSWTCDDYLIRGLPDAEFSPQLNSSLLKIGTKLELYDALIDEKESRLADGAYLKDHTTRLGARPIRVIATGNQFRPSPATPPERRAALETLNRTNLLYQQKLLELSSNAKHIAANKSGTYVQLDAPDILAGAIRDVYDQRIH